MLKPEFATSSKQKTSISERFLLKNILKCHKTGLFRIFFTIFPTYLIVELYTKNIHQVVENTPSYSILILVLRVLNCILLYNFAAIEILKLSSINFKSPLSTSLKR